MLAIAETRRRILEYCKVGRSRNEIMSYLGLSDRKYFMKEFLRPLLASGRLIMTIPGKPRSKNQKYAATEYRWSEEIGSGKGKKSQK